MKNKAWLLLAVLGLNLLASNVCAKPERLPIKDPKRKTNEQAAKARLQNINLQNIEDPEARRAIQEILNFLNLKTQN